MQGLDQDLDEILNHTRPLWEELRGQRIFITGGTGFFGTGLLESFSHATTQLKLNAEAVVLTRDPKAFGCRFPHLSAHPAIKFHAGDIRTFEFPPGSFSHVIHAATAASAQMLEEEPLLMFDTIVDGTRRTLEFAKSSGAKKFLLTSSGAVYGKQPSELIRVPESYTGAPDPLSPGSSYAEGKRAAEHLCGLYQKLHGIECKIARCFAFVGPHLPLDLHFAIGNFIRDGLKGGPIKVGGDGSPFRSYLYASELTEWLWTILFRAPSSVPFNLGSAESVSIGELATQIGSYFGCSSQISQKAVAGAPASRYVPDISRAEKLLGLKPRIDLIEAIDRTARYHRTLGESI